MNLNNIENWSTVHATRVDPDAVNTDIQFGTGWNCCKANPRMVIVFDNGARWAVCRGCASRYAGEVQPLPLRDATNLGIEDIEFIADVVTIKCVRHRRETKQRGHAETHAVEIAERPKNAKERREHAIAVLFYKWIDNPEFDAEAALTDLADMRKLGRTARWQNILTEWSKQLTGGPDVDWSLTQYSIYAHHAA